MDFVAREVRYAARVLRRSPVFSLTCIALLALGIGANTAIFSVIEAVLLRPLPYRDAGRLCVLWKSVPARNIDWDWTSWPTLENWRQGNSVFEDLAFVLRPEGSIVTLHSAGMPLRIQASKVSRNFFDLLGVRPLLGHTLGRVDAAGVVLSYGFWKRQFGRAPDVLGRALQIDERSFAIIGVMPADFELPDKTVQFWMPVEADLRWPAFQRVRAADAFFGLARLKPDIAIATALSDMHLISTRLSREYPATDAGLGVSVVPLFDQIAGPSVRTALWTLGGSALCVLLIVCSNIAGLQVARGLARQKELTVRAALGAGRARLVLLFIIESLLLLLAGGLGGVLLAYAGLPLLRSFLPEDMARLESAAIDWRALLFTVAVCLLSALIAGLTPALHLTKRGKPAVQRFGGLLVAGQLAVAVILLSGAGLLIRSFLLLDSVKPGFDPSALLTMDLQLPGSQYNTRDRHNLFFTEALRKIEALPGTQAAVGQAHFGSLLNNVPNESLVIEGRLQTHDIERHARNAVSDSYFAVMGIPLRQGRLFSALDLPDAPPVAVINQAMARHYWPGQSPLGKRFKEVLPGQNAPWLTVIGVVADAVYNRDGVIVPIFYASARQAPFPPVDSLIVRAKSDPLRLIPAIRAAIHSVDPAIPFFEIATVEQHLRELDHPRRIQTELLAIFAGVALILAAVGLYGLMTYSVSRRTREIGIRMALGATRFEVVRLLLRNMLLWAAVGAAGGIAGAVIVNRALTPMLFGIRPVDPATLGFVILVLAAMAVVSSARPAARAAAVDPNITLRHE